jgi:hypothetical protein
MFFLIVVLLVTGWFVARTNGARKYLEGSLSKRFGCEVSISSMYIGWPYELVMDEVRSAGFDAAGTEGFSVQEARFSRGWRYWHLKLNELIVRIKADEKAGWKPSRMARIGDMKDAGMVDIVHATADMRKNMMLRVSNSDISWLGTNGVETAYVRGADFRMLPVGVDGRQMYYYHLSINRSSGLAELDGRNIVREWLTTDTSEYIELPSRSGNPSVQRKSDED